MTKLVCYNPSHYQTFTAAMRDGAIDETGSSMDALQNYSGVFDLMEVEAMVNARLGVDCIRMGVYVDEVFITLSQYNDLEFSGESEAKREVQAYISDIQAAYQCGYSHGINAKLVSSVEVEDDNSITIDTPVDLGPIEG